MSKIKLLLSSLLFMSAAACTAPVEDDTERVRGSDDKADLTEFWGACGDGCGGPSEYGNCWCDESCAANQDCCEDVAICELEPVTFFNRFMYRFEGGKPASDNASFIEVRGDGTIVVDKMFDPGGGLYTAQLSYPDYLEFVDLLVGSSFMDDMYDDVCAGPGGASIFEHMLLETSQGNPNELSTGCNVPSILAVRIAVNNLARKYVP